MSMMKRISTIFRAKANRRSTRRRTPGRPSTTATSASWRCSPRCAAAWPTWPPAASGSSCSATSSQTQSDKLTEQAQKAISMGREDLAREALTRKSGADRPDRRPRGPARPAPGRGGEAHASPPSGCRPRSSPSAPARRPSRRPTPPPRRRPGSARRSPASPRRWATSGMAVQRAEDKTQAMQARAGAIDELIASGALDDASSINRGDDISRELESMSSQADVEAELAALKGSSAPGHRRRPRRRARPPLESVAQTEAARSRRDSSRDRAHPRRGTARGGRRPARVPQPLDAASRPRSRPVTTTRSRRPSAALLDGVRSAGTPLAEDSLEDSDLILPPADATIDEVRELLSDDGLIPG